MVTAAPQPKLEPKAVKIARDMMQAMGGEAAWKQARYVRFDFIVTIYGRVRFARAHLWDKRTGRFRLEDTSPDQQSAVVLFNTRNQTGTAYAGGRKLEGAAAESAVEGGYRAYRTDIDWLALPWNWLAPGVGLKYLGEKSLKGQAFDVVEVTVSQPAGTPAMRYSAYVSQRSHMLEYCSVGVETSLWDWQYATVGAIRLASGHTNTEKQASISMGNVKVLDNVDDAFLTDPARSLTTLK